MTTRAHRLLVVAKAFHDAPPSTIATRVPVNVDDALAHMHTTLWHEAAAAMQEPLPHPPSSLKMHVLDLDTPTPAIVVSLNPQKQIQMDSELAAQPRAIAALYAPQCVSYPSGPEAGPMPYPHVDKKTQGVRARQAKHAERNVDRMQRQAQLAEKRDAAFDQRVVMQAERQRQRACETKEQRAVRMEASRSARALKKAESDDVDGRSADGLPGPAHGSGDQAGDDKPPLSALAPPPPRPECGTSLPGPDDDNPTTEQSSQEVEPPTQPYNDHDTARQDGRDKRDTASAATKDARDSVVVAERESILATDRVLPASARRCHQVTRRRCFQSPVPMDRFLFAMQFSAPRQAIQDALLGDGIPSDAVKLVQGPPGTGKSRHLCHLVETGSFERALVCAPSNVAAAHLYELLLASGVADDISLCICPDRVPGHVEVASNHPAKRIVCTTISARAGPVLHLQAFDAVFVDEAAQCLEAHIWTLLRPEVETLIMAGDVHQLPAVVSEAGKRAALDRSLLQRLLDNGYPHDLLSVQHRMHPEISRFPNRQFYENRLRDADHTATPGTGDSRRAHYVCTVVPHGEETRLGTSVFNAAEVEVCARLVSEYLADFAPRDIVVIAPYQAQCQKLLATQMGVAIHTVDSFQGHESPVVILSVVRNAHGGFWDDYRRLNVALTRAKCIMHVVGAFGWKSGPLAAMAADARGRGLLA